MSKLSRGEFEGMVGYLPMAVSDYRIMLSDHDASQRKTIHGQAQALTTAQVALRELHPKLDERKARCRELDERVKDLEEAGQAIVDLWHEHDISGATMVADVRLNTLRQALKEPTDG